MRTRTSIVPIIKNSSCSVRSLSTQRATTALIPQSTGLLKIREGTLSLAGCSIERSPVVINSGNIRTQFKRPIEILQCFNLLTSNGIGYASVAVGLSVHRVCSNGATELFNRLGRQAVFNMNNAEIKICFSRQRAESDSLIKIHDRLATPAQFLVRYSPVRIGFER